MGKFLVEYMGEDYNGRKYLLVDEDNLDNGVYVRDREYVEIGEVLSVKEYEDGLKVIELDTGLKVVEVRVKRGEYGGRYEYLLMA